MVVEAADAAEQLEVVVVVLSKVRCPSFPLSTINRVFCHQVNSYDPPDMYYASVYYNIIWPLVTINSNNGIHGDYTSRQEH